MTEAVIVEIDEQGTVTLPEEIRRDLPGGTQFLVHRHDDSIVMVALPEQSAASYDLSDEAFAFANELIAEGYEDYMVQAALTDNDD